MAESEALIIYIDVVDKGVTFLAHPVSAPQPKQQQQPAQREHHSLCLLFVIATLRSSEPEFRLSGEQVAQRSSRQLPDSAAAVNNIAPRPTVGLQVVSRRPAPWAKRSCPGAGMLGRTIAACRQQADLRPRISSSAASPPPALVGAYINESIHSVIRPARFSGRSTGRSIT